MVSEGVPFQKPKSIPGFKLASVCLALAEVFCSTFYRWGGKEEPIEVE